MARWKRFGVVVLYRAGDHDPKHVHVFEHGKHTLKFDVQAWKVMKGQLSFRARRALESLREEGVFDDRSSV